jgi:hypothetical protein
VVVDEDHDRPGAACAAKKESEGRMDTEMSDATAVIVVCVGADVL